MLSLPIRRNPCAQTIFLLYYLAETARQSDWDGIIACHQRKLTCTTWNFVRSTMGAYKLKPPNLIHSGPKDVYATVSISHFSV